MRPFPPEVVAAYRAAGLWGDRTVHAVFAANAAAHPTRPALLDAPNRSAFAPGAPRRLDYAALSALVDRLAAQLHAQGLRAGDALLVQMPNVHELVALYLAAARLGVVLSPVPVQYRRAELAPILALLKPRAVCVLAGSAQAANFPGAPLLELDAAALPDAPPPPAFADPDALFTLCWTSGTEGRPKAVPKTHNNWLCSRDVPVRAGWLAPGGVLLAPFPFVNAAAIGGLLMAWLGAAGTLVLHHPFTLDVFLSQVAAERVAYTVAAPALLPAIAAAAERDRAALASLRTVGVGSAPVEPALLQRFEAATGAGVVNIFGSNEGLQLAADAGAIPDAAARARSFPRDGDVAWDAARRTANGTRFRLLEGGEMAIAGPSLFPGYLTEGGFDRSGFDAEGFFRTGDLFERVGEDAIRFIGRARELIIRGGMKVAPAELEPVLARHPGVQEVAVAAWPDARLGERIGAFVVPRPGAAVTLPALCALCEAAGLARFKWPEQLMLLAALPRNPLAKVERRRLTALAAQQEESAA